jgi:hypothetical protein
LPWVVKVWARLSTNWFPYRSSGFSTIVAQMYEKFYFASKAGLRTDLILFFKQHFKKLLELAENAKNAYSEMVDEYEQEERETLIMLKNHYAFRNVNGMQPTVPSHMGHSRTPSNGSNISIDPNLINYMTHSRTPSGNFVITSATQFHGGHSRSASGGGTLNIDFGSAALLPFHKHLTHSRNASNCSNISFISRLSEPISECGAPNSSNTNFPFSLVHANNSGSSLSTMAAVQHYSEQVRNEMRDLDLAKSNESPNLAATETDVLEVYQHHSYDTNDFKDADKSSSAANQTNPQLSCIHEIDAGI